MTEIKNKSNVRNLIYIVSCVILTAGLVILDQITKYIAFDRLKGNESVVFIKGFLSFTYVENRGAAWGVLSGKMNILVIITIIIVPFIIFMMIKTEKAKKYLDKKKTKGLLLFQTELVLLLAGAVGNFIDRVMNGFVIDFFEFTFIDFPVFNVADCYITVGTILLMITYVFLLDDNDMEVILKGKKALKKEVSQNDEVSD